MAVVIFFIAHWYFSLFSQTFLMHRYAAHGAFSMSKSWERFFYIVAYITMGSSYLSARAYAVMHRMHHAYTDTEKDPHSPKYHPNLFSMMRQTANVYRAIYLGTMDVDERFKKNVPDWPAMDKWAQSWMSRLMWAALYIVFYFMYAPSYWWFLLLPVHFLMGPVHGAIINWFAHKYGYTNFSMDNTSRNLLPVDFLMLGESYHNNHHKYASSVNFGVKWFEIDPIYYVILLFNFLGIIRLKKIAVERIATEF